MPAISNGEPTGPGWYCQSSMCRSLIGLCSHHRNAKHLELGAWSGLTAAAIQTGTSRQANERGNDITVTEEDRVF